MKSVDFFLTTRKNEKLYKFIVNPAKIHAESILKTKLEIRYFKHADYPSINFILYVFYLILTGKFFFNEKFINLKYSDYIIGRYILSNAMREGGYYRNKIIFFFSKLRFLIIAGKLINSLSQINKKVKGIYIDHGMYINGIILQASIRKGLIIYSNNYPRGLFSYDFRKAKKKDLNLQYEDLVKLKPKKIDRKKLLKIKKLVRKISYHSNAYPWMSKTKFIDLKNYINLKKITHIIYAHSFLETQYMFGYDGFLTYEDWLIFTIKKLSENNQNIILVKAHPNFYAKNFSNINYIDLKIFKKIKKKFNSNPNIFFLDYPYKNYKLLKRVSKETTLIVRHSSTLIEAIYFRYKVIFSAANVWDTKYLVEKNCWTNLAEYTKLLKKDWNELSYFSQSSFYRLSYDLFCNDKNYFGDKTWHRLLVSKLKISLDDYILGNVNQEDFGKKEIIFIEKLIANESIDFIKS